MSSEAPMTPEGCDLRGLEWMPLYGGRLFGSDFDAHATDAEWRAALQLWWAAWNQVPAASLPDDDVALCRLAGFGRDVKAWRKVKPRALYGFTLCTDGRFYHKALAVFALDSWQRRLKDRERKAKYRAQKDQPHNEDRTRTETGTGRGQGVGQPRHGMADEKRQDETGQDATLKTGGKVPPRDVIFAEGLPWLMRKSAKSRDACAKMIGHWLKETGDNDQAVLDAMQAAERENPADPFPWIAARLKPKEAPETWNQRRIREGMEAIRQ